MSDFAIPGRKSSSFGQVPEWTVYHNRFLISLIPDVSPSCDWHERKCDLAQHIIVTVSSVACNTYGAHRPDFLRTNGGFKIDNLNIRA